MNDKRNSRTQPPNRVAEGPLPKLAPYKRCKCGRCPECESNAKWDAVFAKFEVQEDRWPSKGMFRSTLRGW